MRLTLEDWCCEILERRFSGLIRVECVSSQSCHPLLSAYLGVARLFKQDNPKKLLFKRISLASLKLQCNFFTALMSGLKLVFVAISTEQLRLYLIKNKIFNII